MINARHLRYAAYLSAFNYEVHHRLAENHMNVDYLSRYPLPSTEPSHTQLILYSEILQIQEGTMNCITSSSITGATIEIEIKKESELSKLLLET